MTSFFISAKVSPSIFKLLRSDGKDEEAKNKVWNGLQNICDELSKRGNFFGGDVNISICRFWTENVYKFVFIPVIHTDVAEGLKQATVNGVFI